MNSLRLYPTIIIFIFSVSACAGTPVHVDLTVVDGDGQPVVNAVVGMDFLLSHGSNGFEGNTNAEGKVETTNLASFGVGILVQKDGFYPTEYRSGYGHQKLTLLLREKKNPIAMYAREVLLSAREPRKNGVEFGYDLAVGDFVSPYGKGVISDFLITHKYSRTDFWNYSFEITIKFSNPEDGLIPFHFEQEISEYKSDYFSPKSGYLDEFVIHGERQGINTSVIGNKDKKRNFYFRVRTAVNDDGEVVSAHYGKTYGGFPGISYFFNPTPNDRNIEFDPTKNIFKNLMPEERVLEP